MAGVGNPSKVTLLWYRCNTALVFQVVEKDTWERTKLFNVSAAGIDIAYDAREPGS